MICANVGGLLLARATKREKETAVRLALGASRWQIVRQWLAESLLLVLIGGGTALVLAYMSVPLVARWLPPARGIGLDPSELRIFSLDLHPDLRVAAFSMCLCALTTVLSAVAPIWRSGRRDLYLVLKTTIGDGRQRHLQAGLCAVQVALCTVLLISAGLMTRSLGNLQSVHIGFDRDHVVIFSLDPHVRGYDSQQTWSLERRLIEGAQSLPGVESAALANRALMRGIGLGNAVVFPGQRGDGIINTSTNSVTPDYFNVMGMRIVAGRGFTGNDAAEEGKVAPVIVNEAFVRRFLGNGDPIGREFATGKEFVKPQYEIVGVVNDANYRSLRETPPPIFYFDGFGPKAYPDAFVLHVRAHGDPRLVIEPMRDLLRMLDPGVPLFQAATLSEEVDRSLWQERLLAALSSCVSIFAATLTAIGLYGIVAYFVAARRQEIGLRLALGANSYEVAWLVVRHVVPPMMAGMLAGASVSFLAGAWIQSLLYGVQPFDHGSVSIAVSVILVVGTTAAVLPALRAMRIDPASTLREE
jgi:predicted permease